MQRTARLAAPLLALALSLSACTGDDGSDGNDRNGRGETAPRTGATGETAPTPVDPNDASETTATYEYVNAGLRVVMEVDGAGGTMQVENGTDHEVGRPGFYILDATTGEPTDGRVQAGAPVEAGASASFDVSMQGVAIEDVGLVILLLGKDNYGAFVRTA
ncbi:MAG TPA: hypothetical protein VEC15_09145 [Actinomycetota bacterium]|nr:hypothetical protein [Actinomycetota bacterium]